MPSTSGSSSAPGDTVTGYGSIVGWERNWLPRVSAKTGKARGVVYGPSPLTAGGSMALFVPCSANHRPPASTHARSACCVVLAGTDVAGVGHEEVGRRDAVEVLVVLGATLTRIRSSSASSLRSSSRAKSKSCQAPPQTR